MARTFATFDAPASASTPPGRELAEQIRTALPDALHPSTLDEHDDYGWEFEVQVGSDSHGVLLQLSDSWLLIIAPRKRLLGLLGAPSAEATRSVSLAVHRALVTIGASEIRWFAREEFESNAQGAEEP